MRFPRCPHECLNDLREHQVQTLVQNKRSHGFWLPNSDSRPRLRASLRAVTGKSLHHLPAVNGIHVSHERFALLTHLEKAFKTLLLKGAIAHCDPLQRGFDKSVRHYPFLCVFGEDSSYQVPACLVRAPCPSSVVES